MAIQQSDVIGLIKSLSMANIPNEFKFVDALARDTYFIANPDRLYYNMTIAININGSPILEIYQGQAGQPYVNTNWLDVSGLIKGQDGVQGANGIDGTNGTNGLNGAGVTNGTLYFREGADTAPINFDWRIRTNTNGQMYMEKYLSGAWTLAQEVSSSITTDYVKLEGNNIGFLDKISSQDLKHIWRRTSTTGGNQFGDASRKLFLIADQPENIRISYRSAPTMYQIVTTKTIDMSSPSFELTTNYPNPFDMEAVYIELSIVNAVKVRLTVFDVLDDNRITYQTMNDSDFLSTGGVILKDFQTNATTGDIVVKLPFTTYFIAGRQYKFKIEMTQGTFKGNGTFPYSIVNGYESPDEAVASRDWVQKTVPYKKSATDGVFYLNGSDDTTDNNIRAITTNGITKYQRRVAGVWKDSPFVGDLVSHNEATGWVKGAQLSIDGVDNTKFNVSAGKVKIYDYTLDPDNPTYKVLEWTSPIASTAGLLGTGRAKWVGIKDDGIGNPQLIVQDTFSASERRDVAVIGKIRNSSGTGPIITNVDQFSSPNWNINASFQDYMLARGSFVVSGNVIAPNASLQLSKSAGSSWRYHAELTKGFENIHADVQENPRTSYAYVISGTQATIAKTALDPLNYDNNGVLTPLSTNNKWSKQEIYIFPVTGSWFVVYGDKEYSTLNDAVLADHRPLTGQMATILEGSYHAASVVLQKTTTNLSADIASNAARLIPATAGTSSIPISLPGIYVGATPTTSGVTGTVPPALSSERTYFLKGDGTYAIGLSPSTDNNFTGQNVFKDSKFFITKNLDPSAGVAFNANSVATGNIRAVNIQDKDGTMALKSDIEVVFTNTTQRLAGTTELPTYYTPRKFFDATLGKMLLYRQLESTPSAIYRWFEDDGIEEYMATPQQTVPTSPTDGQTWTSAKGYVYTWRSASIYWQLTATPSGTGGGGATKDWMLGTMSGNINSSVLDVPTLTKFTKNGLIDVVNTNQILLKANTTYKLECEIAAYGGSAGTFFTYGFFKASDSSFIPNQSLGVRWINPNTTTYSGNSKAQSIYTTGTSDEYIKIRCGYNGSSSNVSVVASTNVAGSGNDGGDSYFMIESIASTANALVPVSGTYVDYAQYTLSANSVNLTVNQVVPFSQVLTTNGNILNNAGVFTLKSNKTYELEACISGNNSVANNVQWGWYNATTGVQLPNSTVGGGMATSHTGNYSIQCLAKCIITPTQDTNVDVRMTYCGTFTAYRGSNINGTVDTGSAGGGSYCVIRQLGSSAVYTDARTTIANPQVLGLNSPTPTDGMLYYDYNSRDLKMQTSRRLCNLTNSQYICKMSGSTTSIPASTFTPITFSSKSIDTHGTMGNVNNTNCITIQEAGIYRVTVQVSHGGSSYIIGKVLLNGTEIAGDAKSTTGTAMICNFSTIVQASQGNNIQVQVYSGSSTTMSTNYGSSFCIVERIG